MPYIILLRIVGKNGEKVLPDYLNLEDPVHQIIYAELGTSLFEIALSLFALERTFILRAMALLETKSEAL